MGAGELLGIPDYSNVQQAGNISQSTGSIADLPQFMQQSQNLTGQLQSNQGPSFASQLSQSNSLLSLYNGMAQGTVSTAADKMLQAAQQQQAAQAQSSVLAARGSMSSPLAFRQIANQTQQAAGNTSTAMATQKLQEQMMGANGASGIIGQQAGMLQNQYSNFLNNIQAQQGVNQSGFNASNAQTQNNIGIAQSNQSTQVANAGQKMQQDQSQAAAMGAITSGVLKGATAMLGA